MAGVGSVVLVAGLAGRPASSGAAPPPSPGVPRPGIVAATAGAGGSSVTTAELVALARAAATDAGALARLRRVTEVDGRPFDVATLLDGADRSQLPARLTALGASVGPPSATGSDAPARAREILARDKYQPSTAPKPFAGLLEWLGRQLRPMGRLADWLFGTPTRAAITLGLLLTAGAVTGARLARHRDRAQVVREDRRRRRSGLDPDELEREAAAAEGEGRYDDAVRLRFRAGLVRLGRSGAAHGLADGPSGRLAAELRSPRFEGLAADFDEIVYGGRTARSDDAARARVEWPRLLDEAGRR